MAPIFPVVNHNERDAPALVSETRGHFGAAPICRIRTSGQGIFSHFFWNSTYMACVGKAIRVSIKVENRTSVVQGVKASDSVNHA